MVLILDYLVLDFTGKLLDAQSGILEVVQQEFEIVVVIVVLIVLHI